MGLDELLGKGFTIANTTHYRVRINDEEFKDLTYMELGLYLVNTMDKITEIYIKTRD